MSHVSCYYYLEGQHPLLLFETGNPQVSFNSHMNNKWDLCFAWQVLMSQLSVCSLYLTLNLSLYVYLYSLDCLFVCLSLSSHPQRRQTLNDVIVFRVPHDMHIFKDLQGHVIVDYPSAICHVTSQSSTLSLMFFSFNGDLSNSSFHILRNHPVAQPVMY